MTEKEKKSINKINISFNEIKPEDIFRILFQESRDGIVLIDSKSGQILDSNLEFQRQTGRTHEELKKLKIWQLQPIDKQKLAKEKFSKIKETGIGYSRELEFFKKDGTITPIDFLSKIVNISDREYIISSTMDISISKKIEKELVSQKNELEFFASSIAHDLRGKIQLMKLLNELQLDSIYKERMSEQITEMGNFLENLLVLAKKGEIVGELKVLDLTKLLNKILEKFKFFESDITLQLDSLPEVLGDEIKLKQVFENLIINIIKHSKATRIQISSKENKDFNQILIIDNGIGIPKIKQKQIIESWNNQKYTSMGLIIAKKIIDAHSGKIQFESSESIGTTFYISLPKIKKKS
ncbi:MAG TPA: PAS domain-containing sensor histidine kinase [candidate division Zixibacteria bacterium]|nr:PAS domain-containing sensor histidine kinase [candidate division Zixibacteria bacterium]